MFPQLLLKTHSLILVSLWALIHTSWIDKWINAEIPQWRYIEKSLARHKKKYGSKITKKQAEIFHFGDNPSDFEDILFAEDDKYKKQSFFWGACSQTPEGESDGGSGCEDDFIDSKFQTFTSHSNWQMLLKTQWFWHYFSIIN